VVSFTINYLILFYDVKRYVVDLIILKEMVVMFILFLYDVFAWGL